MSAKGIFGTAQQLAGGVRDIAKNPTKAAQIARSSGWQLGSKEHVANLERGAGYDKKAIEAAKAEADAEIVRQQTIADQQIAADAAATAAAEQSARDSAAQAQSNVELTLTREAAAAAASESSAASNATAAEKPSISLAPSTSRRRRTSGSSSSGSGLSI